MADAEEKSWTFLKGVGGVAGAVATAVLTAVLVRHFTQPDLPNPPVPIVNTPVQAQLGLAGFVKDATNSKVVSGAMVRVGLGPNVAAQDTDTQGQYSFILSGADPKSNQIVVAVQAPGYQDWTGTYTLPAGPRFADVSIVPVVPATGPISTGTVFSGGRVFPDNPTPAPTAQLTFKPPPAALQMRAAKLLVIKR